VLYPKSSPVIKQQYVDRVYEEQEGHALQQDS
jgi:hypothetical protein